MVEQTCQVKLTAEACAKVMLLREHGNLPLQLSAHSGFISQHRPAALVL